MLLLSRRCFYDMPIFFVGGGGGIAELKISSALVALKF